MSAAHRAVIAVAATVAAVILMVVGAVTERAWSTPDCPTEDSCVIDYHDGEWHIREDRGQ